MPCVQGTFFLHRSHLQQQDMVTLGIVVGIIGIVMAGVNYPIYKKMLENGKKKYAFEIVELAKEISDK